MYIHNCNTLKHTTATPSKKKYICKQTRHKEDTIGTHLYTNVNILHHHFTDVNSRTPDAVAPHTSGRA